MRIRLILPLALLLISHIVFSQNVKILPDDPRIHKNVMANGFTYYLVNNDVRQGYADFYLIRSVGSVHEKRGEFGFNALISDMGVEGTRNFPNNAIISFFDEMGLDHHSDFTTVNGIENSLYKVTNIPVERGEAVIDSTLLILYNWAVSINLDEEDVEKGKRLYVNRITGDMSSEAACRIRHLPEVMGDKFFGRRGELDSLIAGVENYKAKDIRSFYYKWFSPERMSLVVVGDIDQKLYETKIKSLFQTLPKFLETMQDDTLHTATQTDPVVSVIVEEECAHSKLTIYLTTPSLPENLRLSAVPYVEEYMSEMMLVLLREKLTQASEMSDISFALNDLSYGSFYGRGDKGALKVEVMTPATDVKKTLGRVLGILYGIKRDGFTSEQFQRAQKLYFKDLNYRYDWRIFTPNKAYAERSIHNYIYGTSLASIEMKKEYMDLVRYQVGLSQFNMFVSSLLRDGDNCIITYDSPGRDGAESFTKEELLSVADSVITEGSASDITRDIKYRPFEYSTDKMGTILSEYPEVITGSKVWNLSNGATVIFKQTQVEPNKFTFEAVSKGGLTLMDGSNVSREYINEIAAISPVGEFSAPEFSLHKKYERVKLEKSFGMNTSSLKGKGYSSSVENFMKMVSLCFMPTECDHRAFSNYKKIRGDELASRHASPSAVFKDTLSTMLYNDSQYISVPNSGEFENVDCHSALSFINDRFSNAANFHFIIVGDIDEALLKNLVSKYIASLPGRPAAKENWRNVPLYLRKYDQEKVIEMPVSSPKVLYNYTISSPAPYNLKGVVEMTVSSEVIRKRVCREMEDRGFPLEIETSWLKHPEEFLTHSFSSVNREYSEEFVSELRDIFRSLEMEGADPKEIRNAKTVILEKFKRGEKESTEFWKELLVNRFVYGKDFYSRYSEFVREASDEEINDAIKSYLQNAVNTVLILKGVEK